MTELEELEELRNFKRKYEASAVNRAFIKLEQIMDAPHKLKADTVMSVTAFKILAEAILELKRTFDERGSGKAD